MIHSYARIPFSQGEAAVMVTSIPRGEKGRAYQAEVFYPDGTCATWRVGKPRDIKPLMKAETVSSRAVELAWPGKPA